MIDIAKAIQTSDGKDLYVWFINQEHLPFDMSSDAYGTYLTLYYEFLQELNILFQKTGDKYYWFTQSGKLVSDEGSDVISGNHIRVDKTKLRNLKLEELLNEQSS